MEISRRGVLTLAVSGAAAVLAGPIAPARAGTVPRLQSAGALRRFPGDPGAGRLYYGASKPTPVRSWENQMGQRLAVHRRYYQSYQLDELVRQGRRDLDRTRLPHQSMKPPGTWGEVAAGAHDGWIRSVADGLGRLQAPVFFTVHHEPEDDAGSSGMQPQDFVRMTTRVISIFGDRAPKVTVFPVLMGWTFDPRSGRNPAEWSVPTARILGVDIYNPWSPTNNLDWVPFRSRLDQVRAYAGGRPIAIGEYGCRTDASRPGRAADWMRDAFDYARANNVVSMSYFNSYLNSPDGTWELDTERGRVFANNLGSASVARVGTI